MSAGTGARPLRPPRTDGFDIEFTAFLDFTAWVGSFVPAGTPQSIVNSLNDLLKRALADRDVTEKLVAATLEPMHMTPEQFAQRLKSDYERYGKLMKEIGVIK